MARIDLEDLLHRVECSLQAPATDARGLQQLLAELYEHSRNQQHLLERLTRISDGYQHAERARGEGYLERYNRELRRLEKIVRISDRYQDMLRDINGQLERMANTDLLTDLPNRRCAVRQLEQALQTARLQHVPLCLALIDIDHFKRINDSFGHPVGDQAIRWIARQLPADLFCARWGGEEFLAVLPGDSQQALTRLEALRLAVEHTAFPHAGQQYALTISVGLSSLQDSDDAHSLLRRADDALYQAKTLGRNRISQLDSPPA